MSALTDFLRQQTKASRPEVFAKRKKEWLVILDAFFKQLKGWLAEAEKQKLIKVIGGKIILKEEALGAYEAPCLTLNFQNKVVEIKPVGSVIIGADGRVDMISSNGTYMFLYVASIKKWVHGVGKEPAHFPELTEELFTELLKRSLA